MRVNAFWMRSLQTTAGMKRAKLRIQIEWQFHSLRIVVGHESVRMTFIAFVQPIHCRQIESRVATVFCFRTNGYGGKCDFGDGFQFAVNRYDNWIGARFLVHFQNGPTAHKYAQEKRNDPPCSIQRTQWKINELPWSRLRLFRECIPFDPMTTAFHEIAHAMNSAVHHVFHEQRTCWFLHRHEKFRIRNGICCDTAKKLHSTRFALTCLLMASTPSLSLSSLSFRFLAFDFLFDSCNLWFTTVAAITASCDGCLKWEKIVSGNGASGHPIYPHTHTHYALARNRTTDTHGISNASGW